jgi:hypothetical protein
MIDTAQDSESRRSRVNNGSGAGLDGQGQGLDPEPERPGLAGILADEESLGRSGDDSAGIRRIHF